ncbi:hypothetical protein H2198_006184 [Neophaeococcomyces mojaviensis]|uniref:Uncharacterized protein n=1 Tax=Neophaeococcomyces mojaviensis TaxID=3383035 RepID=A0ACC3A3S0_9EURO|nr:hypothetical protein H2198_006184 [Knufia sp. JES_112]
MTGLPIILEPVSSFNLAWLITDQLMKQFPGFRPVRDILVRQLMPFSYFGWQYDQGHAIHAKYGPAFVLVAPGSIQVVVGDPAAAYDVLVRRKDFIKPKALYAPLAVFGPNVNTVDGEAWQRHRRLTAPSFNERLSSSVWNESRRQAQQMLKTWLATGANGVSTTREETATLALNVLTTTGLGMDGSSETDAEGKHRMSYNAAITTILRRFPFLLLMPMKWLKASLMPSMLRHLGESCEQFIGYITEMLDNERVRAEKEVRGSSNLLGNLVRAADAEKKDKASIGLTNSEIHGNMFIFTFAGHETTANAITTAITYLARYPERQEWIREEFRYAISNDSGPHWDYEKCFPRLKRCLAIMHETLRVHGPIVAIPKTVNEHPQALEIHGKQHVLPANTFVFVNNHAAQTDPAIWGPDSEEWNPDRWIKKGPNASREGMSSAFDDEELLQPEHGAFLPWADGPRICIGKKFSQVEFVATIATLFSEYRVEPVRNKSSDNGSNINKELDEMLKDSEIATATLQMRQPKRVRLAWKPVDSIGA